MAIFYESPEFEKEYKKLSKKYPSLEYDICDIKKIIEISPTGFGKNFIIIKDAQEVKVIKVKVHCESLRERSVRLIYVSYKKTIEFMFIEIYAKNEKENENKERIDEYLKRI